MVRGYFYSRPLPTNNISSSNDSNFINFANGFIEYKLEECLKNFQIIAVQNLSGTVKILNPLDSSLLADFCSFEELLSVLAAKVYFNRLTIIFYSEISEELYLFRDIFGITPIYYTESFSHFFAFSSSLTSLILIDGLPTVKTNTAKISHYLSWLSDGDVYDNNTFFENVFSVLPGYKVSFKIKEKTSIERYQTFEPKSHNSLSTNEYIDEFRTYFIHSIKNNLYTSGNICAQLSGGLDSSSICVGLRYLEPNIPIHTIYANTNTELTDEKDYASSVARNIGSTHHIVSPDENGLETAVLHTSLYGHPDFMYNSSTLNRSIIRNTKLLGCDTIFSGHSGDAIVGYGRNYITELFEKNQWLELKEALSIPESQMRNLNSSSYEQRNKVIYSLIAAKKNILTGPELINLLIKVCRYFDVPFSFFLKNASRKIVDAFRLPSSVLRDELNYGTGVSIEPIPNPEGFNDSSTYFDVFSTQSIAINEQFYILDSFYQIQHKFPFMDKSLFELSMSVPPKVKYDNGKQRGHLRAAMKGLLPEDVRNRTSKANFGEFGRRATIKLYNDSRDLLIKDHEIWNYVDKKNFQRFVTLMLDNNEKLYVYNRAIYFVSRTIYLAIWLQTIRDKTFFNFFRENTN